MEKAINLTAWLYVTGDAQPAADFAAIARSAVQALILVHGHDYAPTVIELREVKVLNVSDDERLKPKPVGWWPALLDWWGRTR